MSANACTMCGSAHHLAAVHNHLPLAALWFPPYGNPGPQPSSAPDVKAGANSFAAVLKAHEDKVTELIGSLGEADRAIAYKYLYASGMRIDRVDQDLRRAIRREIGKGN
ncbi:MAG TPA: hypothetical protein VGH29_18895 [Candidatus Binataceae bacterium]